MCCPSQEFDPASDPNLADSGFSGVVNTPGVRRGGQSEEERSRGIPGVEDNLVEEVEDNLVTTDEVVDNSNREEIEDTNTVERQDGGRHEEDFGEHLEFEYQEFPPFIGDYAISDEFP